MMTTNDRIRQFLVEELRVDPRLDLGDDFPLVEKSVVDSLGIFTLVQFLESEFDITVEDEELVLDNFGTVGAITRLVEGKLPPAPARA